MPQSAMKGAFGWIGQVAQDDLWADNEYNANGMTWHKVLGGDMGLVDDQRPYDPEVGGSLLPPGTYKSAYWSGGQLSLRPRLGLITGQTKAHSLAPLLWSFAGSAAYFATPTTVVTTATLPAGVMGTATKIEDITGETGDDAIFFPGASGSVQFGVDHGDGDDKWLTFRKLTPTATGYIGETFYNVKVAGITLSSASTGPIGLDLALQGGAGASDTYDQYVLDAFTGEPTAANGWDYASALPVDTIPMAGGGFVKQGACSSSEVRYVRDLQITLGSGLTRPQDMTMIGQLAPGDYSVLERSIGVSYTFLWDNPDLYRKIKLGGIAGVKWSQAPYTSPFWAKFPDLASAYSIGFLAQNVHWMSKPITLRGQNQVVMQVTGLVAAPASGAAWALWLTGADLTNMSTWPSGA